MSNNKLLKLAKIFLCSIRITAPSMAEIPELEGRNYLIPSRPNPAKEPWQTEKPQGYIAATRINSVDYYTKKHPNLLNQASEHFSKKCQSFIISRNIDGDVEYLDTRY